MSGRRTPTSGICRKGPIRPAVLLAVLVTVVAGAFGQRSPLDRTWPPGVQAVPADSPPLPADAALKTFHLAPGYFVELVASEPLVRDPIMMDWDAAGRIWVVELPVYVRSLQAPEPNLEPSCRVVVLEDTDRDGRMDRRTVFADGLIQPRAVKALTHGILVAEPPSIWLMRDTDGDLRADTKEKVTDGYGTRDGNIEMNANSLYWAMDNSIHTTYTEVFLRYKQGRFEVRRTIPSGGQWGVAQDDVGRLYRNRNESALHVDLVPTPYFARNPSLLRRRGSHEVLRDESNLLNVVWPVRPNPGTNRAYQAGINRDDGSLARFTSVCAPMVYRGDRLPAELYGNVFVAEPAANLVARIVLEEGDGEKPRARKAYAQGEFLASTDERFRPVYLSNAPDGTLYIVDMYRGIIQQRFDITEYLRDYIVRQKLEQPTGFGRIYRVMHTESLRDVSELSASTSDLVDALSHGNGWRRDQAQQSLVERGDRASIPELRRLAVSAPLVRTRLHALWTLDGIDAVDMPLLERMLMADSKHLRIAALRIGERWIAEPHHGLQRSVRKLINDPELAVRRQLAASLGALPPDVRVKALAEFFGRHAVDPVSLDAGLSSARGLELDVLQELLGVGSPHAASLDAAMIMLAATMVRTGQDAALQAMFGWIGNPQYPLQARTALLNGAEVALLGAPMPETPVAAPRLPALCPICRKNAASSPGGPCATCPGGRAGPGGAFAFRPVASGKSTGGNRTLWLAREPIALVALSQGSGDLSARSARLLARIQYPGKPGALRTHKPLTVDEQRLYDAGAEIYRNLCQGCHLADGRGQENVAPALTGSRFALAPAEIPIRILLHGKEGTLGLMPPVGSTLTNEKTAAVLTYIRREWGQGGSPVQPSEVEAVRVRTKDRTRPWTLAELEGMLSTGGRVERN